MTLEEMISGFRTIRREWATVKAEESGRAVLAKVVRLMERAGMSLERWFRFMDMSQVNTSCDSWLTGVSGAHQREGTVGVESSRCFNWYRFEGDNAVAVQIAAQGLQLVWKIINPCPSHEGKIQV